MSIFRAAALAAGLLAISAVPAFAHPKLLSSTPAAAGAVAAPVRTVTLHFSEPLVAKFSGAEVTATAMMMGNTMMNHVMKIDGVSGRIDPADPKTLILTLKMALGPGAYRVTWHAVSTDTHRLQGEFAFTVK